MLRTLLPQALRKWKELEQSAKSQQKVESEVEHDNSPNRARQLATKPVCKVLDTNV